MPKGKFVAQNILQVEFMHYPKQQQCILVDLLEQMEYNSKYLLIIIMCFIFFVMFYYLFSWNLYNSTNPNVSKIKSNRIINKF